MLQVAASPPTLDALLKTTICEKKKLPYARSENVTFYDPGCVEGVHVCRDFCGKKCDKTCKNMKHLGGCSRGKLPENFFFCPSRLPAASIEYLSYGLVVDNSRRISNNLQYIKLKHGFWIPWRTTAVTMTIKILPVFTQHLTLHRSLSFQRKKKPQKNTSINMKLLSLALSQLWMEIINTACHNSHLVTTSKSLI